MRKWISLLLAAVLLISQTIPARTANAENLLPDTEEREETYVEGEVLVTLAAPSRTGLAKEGTATFDEEITVEQSWSFGKADAIADSPAEEKELSGKTLYISQVSSDHYSTEELVEELADRADVLSVEPNYYRHKLSAGADPYYSQQWYLDGDSSFQTSSSGIHYKETKQFSQQGEPVVAIVDTGVDYTHEDLAEHMWRNPYSSSSLTGTYGYDFGDQDSDPMDDDEDGHGTHCAGVISAVSENGTGITGISTAKIMALKVFDSEGKASDSSILAAFNYIYRAQSLGVNVAAINCSWGGGGSTPSSIRSLIEKIGEQGGLFLFAAGNDGTDHDNTTSKGCPYDLDSNYVVTVGATGLDDQRAPFSDYGKNSVHLFAPGDLIFSTVNDGVFFPTLYSDAERKNLCTFFTPLDSMDTELFTAPEVGQSSRSVTYLNKIFSQEDFYGQTDSGSFCVSIQSLRNAATVELYLDVTGLSLDRTKTYYLAYDLGVEENGRISWDHHMVKSTSRHFITSRGRTYLRLVSLTGNFRSTSKLYFDNLGISKANLSSSVFGRYNVLSGTSMAAPQAAAAVALLASIHTGDNAAERRARLLNCVRKTDSLSSCCLTGGLLDLSNLSVASTTLPPSMIQKKEEKDTTKKGGTETTKTLVKKVKLNKKNATLRYGKKLKLKATVTPKNASNKKVKWYVSNKKYAKVTQKGVVKAKKKGIGHTVKVYAKATDKSGKKAFCKIRIKKRKLK